MPIRIAAWTALSLIAFAGNSIVARLALREGAIDPVSFSTVRLLAGAVILAPFVWPGRNRRSAGKLWCWSSTLALFVYAVGFSLAYLSLSAATGALVLFAAVQMTMLGVAWFDGDRLRGWQSLGFVLALAGLVYLVLPGLEAPSPGGSALMLVAGAAWGWYSLLGRGNANPVKATGANFVGAALLALGLLVAARLIGFPLELTGRGTSLAVLSGAVTSGLGYVIWYRALSGLTATRAATVQLAVPVIAAWGGVLILDESLSWRLLISAALILGGIGLTLRRAAAG